MSSAPREMDAQILGCEIMQISGSFYKLRTSTAREVIDSCVPDSFSGWPICGLVPTGTYNLDGRNKEQSPTDG